MSQKVPSSVINATRDLAFKTKAEMRELNDKISTIQAQLRQAVESRDGKFNTLSDIADFLNEHNREAYPGDNGWRSVLGVEGILE